MGGGAQKISQGGSDWYLRFRSERDLDRPETVRFSVKSVVNHRYAVTTIERDIFNPANVSQGFEFAVMIPSTAFISRIEIGDSDPRLEAATSKQETNSTSSNQNVLRQNFIGNEFSTFVLPIILGPRENASLSVTYEEGLQMSEGLYVHKMFLRPGEIVRHFNVKIEIAEKHEIQDLDVHASVLGDISNETVVDIGIPSKKMVNFTMNTREQAHHFGSKGFYGSVIVQFGLNNPSSEMDVLVQDNYFVHFYDLPKKVLENEKHVILVTELNITEHHKIVSDVGSRLSESHPLINFTFIYILDDKIFLWTSISKHENHGSLQNFVHNLAGTSIIRPSTLSSTELIDFLSKGESNTNSSSTHMFFFTSKDPSNGQEKLRNMFGSEHLSNILVSVFPTEDLNQFRKFLDQKVNIKYSGGLVDESSLTQTQFDSFPQDGHLMVAGKLKGSVKVGAVIVAEVSTVFGMEIQTSSPLSIKPCAGYVTLCNEKNCLEYTESTPSLPEGATSSAQTGNCFWTLHSESNYMGDSKSLTRFSVPTGDFVINSVQKQNQYYQEDNAIDSFEMNTAERLHDFISIQTAIAVAVAMDEEQIKEVENISLKNNLLSPFTQLVVKGEDSELLTYTYDDLLSPLLSQDQHPGHSRPCIQSQELCEDKRSSSCPPISVTSKQEGEVLISGSHPNLNLGDITQATQEGACCWLFFTEPNYAGEVEQFCGGEHSVNLVKIGSVKTV